MVKNEREQDIFSQTAFMPHFTWTSRPFWKSENRLKEDDVKLPAVLPRQLYFLMCLRTEIFKRLIVFLMSHSWNTSLKYLSQRLCNKYDVSAPSCAEVDDGEDDNSICMLLHLHLEINILLICFAAAFLLPKLDELSWRMCRVGCKRRTLCVSAIPPGYLLKMDGLQVTAKHLAATAFYMCWQWYNGSAALSCYILKHSHTATEDQKRGWKYHWVILSRASDLSEMHVKYSEAIVASWRNI